MMSGKSSNFVHLHVHTEYSLLDGASRIGDLISLAKKSAMPAIAITDHGAMYGVIDFYKTCKRMDIKPIIGCEVYMAKRTRSDKTAKIDDEPYHLVLLAETKEGYKNLLKLVSLGYIEGFYYKPRIDFELLSRHSKGLIGLSGCLAGQIPSLISGGDVKAATDVAATLRDILGRENFFLEFQDHGLPEQHSVNEALLKIARELDLGIVATNDSHYNERKDAEAHDILLCIQTGKTIRDEKRLRFPNDEFYLKSGEEMEAIFSGLPEAILNTLLIAERCNVELEFGSVHLPDYELPEGYDANDFLRELCYQRFRRRFPEGSEQALGRLEYELDVIEKMGYAGYFLIVWDFIEYAKQKGIPVGPGRGSAAGSLVAYVLGITDVDPLKYGLLFERFLNPERVTMPDMDIDFCFERRQEVIDYVIQKYGQQCVAQIITFGTMAARAAIRDVGRALSMPYSQVDRIAKMVPFQQGMTLERALEVAPDLHQIYEMDSQVRRLIDLAKSVEGLPRHASVHAAGVVISGKPLWDYVPLQRMSDGTVVTQFTMEGLEELGLLKMDFLGLRTLTVLHDTLAIIGQTRGVEVRLDEVPFDDPNTYRLLGEGETLGIFQLESGWVRETLRELKPSRFEDLIALVALCRPGPMENIPAFIENKRGSPRYPHPMLEPILRETYGVIVYQEQVMQAVSAVAGFSLGQADILRRGMGKKKPELIAAMKEDFMTGAQRNGIPAETAEEIFQLIDRFAGYGFNKSHAAAYALIAYRASYLKANYPKEYMAALLTSVTNSTDKVGLYVEECRRMNIEVLPPDINESFEKFTVVEAGIRFGIAGVKNVGHGAIASIIEARKSGPFRSLRDVCERVDTRLLNKRALESLIKAGAFDSLGVRRSQLLSVLDHVIEQSQQSRRRRHDFKGQTSFFDLVDDVDFGKPTDSLPDMEEFPRDKLLAMEKEVLGLYVSGHPLRNFSRELAERTTVRLGSIDEVEDGKDVTVGGLINTTKVIVTKNGERMLFATVEDLTGSVEVTVFPKVYERFSQYLKSDALVVVKGRVSQQEERVKVIADEVSPLTSLSTMFITIEKNAGKPRVLEELKAVLTNYPGNSPVYLFFPDAGKVVSVDSRYWVGISEQLIREVEGLLGKGSVLLQQG